MALKRHGILAASFAALAAVPAAAQSSAIEGTWSQGQTVLTLADGKPIPFTKLGRQRYEANRASAARGAYSFDPVMTLCS